MILVAKGGLFVVVVVGLVMVVVDLLAAYGVLVELNIVLLRFPDLLIKLRLLQNIIIHVLLRFLDILLYILTNLLVL